jgi:hypothetical protein
MKKAYFFILLLLIPLTLSAQLKVEAKSSKRSNLMHSNSAQFSPTQETFKYDSDTSKINIRKIGTGFSNFNEHKPLVIIDGVRSRRGASQLDVNDIKTISYLTGISATKVFGGKGKNGVIVITTKVKTL